MKVKTLGSSNIEVSEVCLGSMTWGTQNNQQEANAQIEFALEHGLSDELLDEIGKLLRAYPLPF